MIDGRFRTAFAVFIFALIASPAAFGHTDDTPDPAANRCDKTVRRDANGNARDHHAPGGADQDLDETADTPEDLVLKDGSGRYGLQGRSFYVEAIGGGGFGSGQKDDPEGRAAQGGAVQGELDLSNDDAPQGGAVPDVDFNVNAFGPLDEMDNGNFYDSAAGVCVSAGDTKAETGEQYVPTSEVPHP